MDMLREIDNVIKLLEMKYDNSALIAARSIRTALVEAQKTPTNTGSPKLCACGKVATEFYCEDCIDKEIESAERRGA